MIATAVTAAGLQRTIAKHLDSAECLLSFVQEAYITKQQQQQQQDQQQNTTYLMLPAALPTPAAWHAGLSATGQA
jgi:hypothetical protein